MGRRVVADKIVARPLPGDEAAFTTLVERHHGALLRIARVFVGSLQRQDGRSRSGCGACTSGKVRARSVSWEADDR